MPKKAGVHDSMDFVIGENPLLRALTKTAAIQQLEIRFTDFVGSLFTGMPRRGVTYYPVLAVFLLGRGQSYKTFDDYLLDSGNTALIYPVDRRSKSSIRRALLEQVIPDCGAWLKAIRENQQEAAAYYAMHDHTFHELVFGPHKIAGVRFNWRGKLLKKFQPVVNLERHMPQPG